MKLTFLGTSSCEGFPALFCNCDGCKTARQLGGINVRTRSQSLIGDDLLIDFPADTLSHLQRHGVEGHKIKYVFFTHSHADHLYVPDLFYRARPNARNMEAEILHVYCTKGVYEKIAARGTPKTVEIHRIAPFDTVELDGYLVTALPARHAEGDEAVIYLIRGDKTILYAHDTGYFLDEVFDYLKENSVVPDLVTYDCAYVDAPVADTGSHMGIENVRRVMARLKELGVVTENTQQFINHFSHNRAPLQATLEAMVAKDSLRVAYDGCTVEL